MSEIKKKRHWSYLIMGIILLIAGIYVIANPLIAPATLAIIFIVSTFTVGVTRIGEYMANKGGAGLLVIGILNIIFGLIFVFNFFVTVILMPLLAGIWLLVWGVFEVITAFSTRKITGHWWIFLIIGILSVILGFIMVFNLGFAVTVLALYFSIYLIVIGIAEIIGFFIPDNS